MATRRKERNLSNSTPTLTPPPTQPSLPAHLQNARKQKSTRTNAEKIEEARRRAGITSEQMVGTRKITPILKQSPGGIKACLETLRADDTPDTLTFLAKYDSLSASDRTTLTIEEITVAAGLTPRRLVELISGAMTEQSNEAATLIVAAAKPKIIAAMVREAKKAIGEKDRENFLRGKDVDWFVPTKGITVDARTQNNILNAGGNDNNRALPPPKADDFLLQMQSAIRPDSRMIEAPQPIVTAHVPTVDYVEADV